MTTKKSYSPTKARAFYPVLDKKYFKDVVSYFLKLRDTGAITDPQFTAIMSNICSNYVENMITTKIESQIVESILDSKIRLSLKKFS